MFEKFVSLNPKTVEMIKLYTYSQNNLSWLHFGYRKRKSKDKGLRQSRL